MKKIRTALKILRSILIGFLLLLFLTAVAVQTSWFKNWFRGYLENTLSKALQSSVHVGKLRGNFITFLEFDSVSVRDSIDVVISADHIRVRYGLLPLTRNVLSLSEVRLVRPDVRLRKYDEKGWNIGRMFKPSEDASTAPFAWRIEIKKFLIEQGRFSLRDDPALSSPAHTLDPATLEYHAFRLDSITMDASLSYNANDISATIARLSVRTDPDSFHIARLSGVFHLDKHGGTARDLIIETGGSSVKIDAAMERINIFDGVRLDSMRTYPTSLRLTGRRIDLRELRWFLPPVAFLDGSTALDLEVQGQFGDLGVRKLVLESGSTRLDLQGSVRNLHRPESLFLDIEISPSRATLQDPAALMPVFGIPVFDSLGTVTLSGAFLGYPTDFRASITVSGPFGEIATHTSLNLKSTPPEYASTFEFRHLNLKGVTGSDRWSSSLFGHGSMEGQGFAFEELRAKATLDIDSGSVRDIEFFPSSVSVTGTPYRLDGGLRLSSGTMSATMDGQYVSGPLGATPAFSSFISLTSLDLADILGTDNLSSDLSLAGHFEGSGTTLADLSVSASIDLLPSTVAGNHLDAQKIYLDLNQHSVAAKHLTLTSSVADLDIAGRFALENLGTPVLDRISVIVRRVARNISLAGDTATSADLEYETPASGLTSDYAYSLSIKNLQSISTLLRGTPFNGLGTIEGQIREDERNFSATAQATFSSLYLGSIREGVLLEDMYLDGGVQTDLLSSGLNDLRGTIDVSIGSLTSNVFVADSISARLDAADSRGRFSISGTIDTTHLVSMVGGVEYQPGIYAFLVDTVTWRHGRENWKSSEPFAVRLDTIGLTLSGGEFSMGSESVSLRGSIRDSAGIALDAVLRDFDIGHLASLTGDSITFSRGSGFEGILNAEAHISGTASEPTMNIRAHADQFGFRSASLGSLVSELHYRHKELTFSADVRHASKDSLPSLSIEGMIPADLSFTETEERFPERPQHVRITAHNLPVGVFEPFVPELKGLTGNLQCNITIGGIPQSPSFSGSITIPEARFTFTPNNVAYRISGTLTPRNDRLLLDGLTLENLPGEPRRGSMKVNGFITIRNYTIDKFDLNARGDLLFLTDASRNVASMMWGRLLASTDDNGLTIRGSFDEPFIEGNLLVQEADLVFPTRETYGQTTSANTLRYIPVDDTTRGQPDEAGISMGFYLTGDSTMTSDQRHRGPSQSNTFVDRLRYNLSIEALGKTQIRMVFTPSTKEELFAELRGKVNAINQGRGHTVYGDIDVVRPSYYNFLKQFDATGALRFVGAWDNPMLGITAIYEGYRTVSADQVQGSEQSQSSTSGASTQQKVLVVLSITGSRYEPKLDMAIKLIGESQGDTVDWGKQRKGGDVQSDAISFILTGKFRDDLSVQDRQGLYTNLEETATSSVLAGVSSSLSGYLTDFVRKEFPFIRRAEVLYGGGSFEEGTRVSLAGGAWYGTWRIAGRIFNSIGSANINYEINIGDIIKKYSLRNLFLELERKVEGSDSIRDEKTTNSARLYYRISF